MFKLLFVQLCLASMALAATTKGVKRDVVSPGSIANLFARDDDLYYQNQAYPAYSGYAGGYGYYPRSDVISPLYYNDGYSGYAGYGGGIANGWGYGGVGLAGGAYPYNNYYGGGGGAAASWPGSYYNRYRYGNYAGYGLGYGLGYY